MTQEFDLKNCQSKVQPGESTEDGIPQGDFVGCSLRGLNTCFGLPLWSPNERGFRCCLEGTDDCPRAKRSSQWTW